MKKFSYRGMKLTDKEVSELAAQMTADGNSKQSRRLVRMHKDWKKTNQTSKIEANYYLRLSASLEAGIESQKTKLKEYGFSEGAANLALEERREKPTKNKAKLKPLSQVIREAEERYQIWKKH